MDESIDKKVVKEKAFRYGSITLRVSHIQYAQMADLILAVLSLNLLDVRSTRPQWLAFTPPSLSNKINQKYVLYG